MKKFWDYINFQLNKEMYDEKDVFDAIEQQEIEFSYQKSIQTLKKRGKINWVFISLFNLYNIAVLV